ncbi:MAG: hypothetical protein RIF46_01410 [Cyclobacteriaceae bacterium]
MTWPRHINRLISEVLLPAYCYGLECQMLEGGAIKFLLTQSSFKKGEFKVHHSQELDSLAEVRLITKSAPTILVVSGQGVITKRLIEGQPLLDVFPGMDISSVRVLRYQCYGSEWAAVMKSSELYKLLSEANEIGIKVTEIHLSGLSAIPYFKALDLDRSIQFGAHLFEWDNDHLTNYRFAEENEEYDRTKHPRLEVEEMFLVSALIVLSYFSHRNKGLGNSEELWSEFVGFRIRMAATLCLIGMTVLVPIVSIGMNQYYLEKNSLLEDRIASLSAVFQNRQENEFELNQNSNLLSVLSDDRDAITSWLEDIAIALPEEASLHEIRVFPLSMKVRELAKKGFKKDDVIISGVVNGIDEFEIFFQQLRAKPWVHEIEVIDILPEPKGSRYHFQIQIEVE